LFRLIVADHCWACAIVCSFCLNGKIDPPPSAELSARNETFSASVSVGVVSPLLGGKKLNISGKASYEDKPYTKDGFTGQLVNTPIRRAAVGLIAIDGFATLATAYTEEDGSYSFSDIDN
jgi:hypothetical protein